MIPQGQSSLDLCMGFSLKTYMIVLQFNTFIIREPDVGPIINGNQTRGYRLFSYEVCRVAGAFKNFYIVKGLLYNYLPMI